MKPWLKYGALGAREGLAWLGSFVLWSLWLALILLLTVQLWVVTSRELALPAFVRRQLEERIKTTGISATFGRTSFDPYGRVLVEDVRLSLAAFPDPVLTARAVYVRFDPWTLLVRGWEPAEIQLMHATVFAPAQISPSGRNEELISSLEATIEPHRHEWNIRQCSARLAQLTVSAHGIMPLPTPAKRPPGSSPTAYLVGEFPRLCRQALALQEKLAQLDTPALDLELSPGPEGAPALAVRALARRVYVDGPVKAEADEVVASLQVTLGTEPTLSAVALSATEVRMPSRATVRGLTAQLVGSLKSGGAGYDLREARLNLDRIEVEGVEAHALSTRLVPLPWPRLDADLTGYVLGAPLDVQATADLKAGTSHLRFNGAISPRVLDVISRRVGTDVRRFYDFESLEAEMGDARFGPGWKFERVSARVRVPRMNSYGVIMEDGRASVVLEPGRFYSPEAFARVGDYFAKGTYEHNLRTHEYRFLLQGRLRPLAISHWFGPWWPNFFQQLEFSAAPPEASVDVTGVWRQGWRSSVFVFADTPTVLIRETPLEHVRTRLFIRPGWFDGLEILATRDGGEAKGTFSYRLNEQHEWDTLDLDLVSSFDLPLIAELIGPTAAKSLNPYHLTAPPALKVHGSLHGSKSDRAREDLLQIEANTTGEFRFHEFPLQDVSFSALLKGGDVTIDRFHATFADGAASGNARVWGPADNRRVGFNVALENAMLGQAATTLQAFLALQRGQPPPAPGKFVQERADLRLNVAASAEGSYNDPLSYRGDGNASLHGLGIGEVPLLGLLSELFTFTSLRFTDARSNFKIEGPKLVFPKIELRGANSAIDAHGDFALDRSELNFIAKVFPFQESGNVLKSVVGAVLTPLSNALEVKLTGTLEKPNWAFVMGPANLLRSLAEGGSTAPKSPTPGQPTPSPASPAPAPTPLPAAPAPDTAGAPKPNPPP